MARTQTDGFTLLEFIVVLVIAAVLLSVAVEQIGTTRARLAGNAARQSFLALHARTRAQAIEFGMTARLYLDTTGDSAWIVQGGQTIERYRFGPEGVDVGSNAVGSPVEVCMIARGYSEPRCNSFTESVELTFTSSESVARLVLLPTGQVRW